MADFKTHVTTSTVLGIGYAGAGLAYGISAETSLVAGGLCGISGMLPDVDSDGGIPIREIMAFAAAVVPMFLIHEFRALRLQHDSIILAGGSIYLLIRFGLAELLRRYTVHRGMFHSIPAAIIFAELGFLMCGCDNLNLRYYKAGAVLLGFMSHLLLDEMYSVEWRRGRWHVKRSFGTALKLWGNSVWANVSTYVKLVIASALVFRVLSTIEQGPPGENSIPRMANDWLGTIWK